MKEFFTDVQGRNWVSEETYDAIVAEVREWAAYCRSCPPGPNIADTMLKFIGDPPHDYSQSDTTKEGPGAGSAA
jgi:hypothetical protein